MKKTLRVSLIIFVLCISVFSGEKFMVSVAGNYLNPSDSGYKDVYGSSVLLPEIKAGYKLYKGFYIWAGYGFFSKEGTTTELKQEAKSTQHFLSFGIGYDGKISKKFGYKAELGLLNASYKEEAFGEKVTDNSIGFGIETGILYRIWSGIFIKISAGYLSASDTVEDVKIKLGGFKAGIGLEARF
jgi:hypothetical protein